MMGNIIIIGSGPAGVSAALYAVRSGVDTTIISKDGGALKKADKIENYYGFAEPIDAKRLMDNGITQAISLGITILNQEVLGIGFKDKFIVKTHQNEHFANSVIIATGVQRRTPDTLNLSWYEGKGLSYCAVCDGFFHKGKSVAVLGSGQYALSEALELSGIAQTVTILTNGEDMSVDVPEKISVVKTPIRRLIGDEKLSAVEFIDDIKLEISGMFIALGVAGSSDLAKKIGIIVKDNKIVVNEHMETNIAGIFAAGDCTGGMLQIAKSVYEGAKAGVQAIKFLKEHI